MDSELLLKMIRDSLLANPNVPKFGSLLFRKENDEITLSLTFTDIQESFEISCKKETINI